MTHPRTLLLVLATTGLVRAGGVDVARAECLANETAKLIASDGAVEEGFGYSVAISGDTTVIGELCFDNNWATGAGWAYVFRFDGSTWAQQAKLLPSDGAADNYFAYSVAISGDTVVIGAFRNDDNGTDSGSAYVFRFDGSSWVEEAKLLPSDGAAGDAFGYSVAVSGDTVVIGVPGDGNDNGSAYVFVKPSGGWGSVPSPINEDAKLAASDSTRQDRFGVSVAISGNTAVIGAVGNDDNGIGSGSAYVFRFDGSSWVEEAKLLASDGAENDEFGCSVALSGDTAVIGANDVGADLTGKVSAYVFRFNGSSWIEEAKLLPSDGRRSDYSWFVYPVFVAIFGDTAVIGVNDDDDDRTGAGSAYVFRFDGSTWVEQAKLLASDGAEGDVFGRSVALSGDTAVIGSASGSVYVFGSMSDCQRNGMLDICDIVNGTSEDCQPNSVPDECDITDGTSNDYDLNGVPDECVDTTISTFFKWGIGALALLLLIVGGIVFARRRTCEPRA